MFSTIITTSLLLGQVLAAPKFGLTFPAVVKVNAPLSSNGTLPCVDLEFIVSRGSLEPKPLGSRCGPNLMLELQKTERLGKSVIVVGLDYP
jgi:hypothetical protein